MMLDLNLDQHWGSAGVCVSFYFEPNQGIQQYLSILQSFDEGRALVGAGSHGLCPALPEQTGHRRLVRQTETTAILEEEEKEEGRDFRGRDAKHLLTDKDTFDDK